MDTLFTILAAHPEANIIGGAAAILGGLWPLFRTRRGMLWAQAAIHVGMCTHFYLLGALSGSLMNALGLGQVLAAIPLGTRPGFKKLYLAYLPIIALGLVYTWQGPVSLFAAGGIASLSLARYQTDIMKFRALTLITIASWSVYDVMVMSIPGMTLDVLSLFFSLLMIRREHRLSKAVLEAPVN